MKKKATVLIASIMAFCGINTAHADEGMWTIYNLPNAVYEICLLYTSPSPRDS